LCLPGNAKHREPPKGAHKGRPYIHQVALIRSAHTRGATTFNRARSSSAALSPYIHGLAIMQGGCRTRRGPPAGSPGNRRGRPCACPATRNIVSLEGRPQGAPLHSSGRAHPKGTQGAPPHSTGRAHPAPRCPPTIHGLAIMQGGCRTRRGPPAGSPGNRRGRPCACPATRNIVSLRRAPTRGAPTFRARSSEARTQEAPPHSTGRLIQRRAIPLQFMGSRSCKGGIERGAGPQRDPPETVGAGLVPARQRETS